MSFLCKCNARTFVVGIMALAIFPGWQNFASAESPRIKYELSEPARVSLAIYDSNGRMVRTLSSGTPQAKGEHLAEWDGLDMDGKPAAPGYYEWRLLSSQGMKAEYLLSLGTSVGIEHWVGQHGGPNTIALSGDSIFVGGHPEGSPLMMKAALSGAAQFPIAEPWGEPASGTQKICVVGDTLHVLMGSSRLWEFKTTDGTISRRGVAIMLLVRTLDAIAPTVGSKTMEIEVPRAGRYALRVKVGQDQAANAAIDVRVGDQGWNCGVLEPGKFKEAIIPRLYDNDRPVESRDGRLTMTIKGAEAQSWAMPALELLTPAEFIDARFGELVASFPAIQRIAWLDPETCKLLEVVEVPDRLLTAGQQLENQGVGLGGDGLPARPHDGSVAVVAPGEALLISGNSVIQLSRKGVAVRRVEGLSSPKAIAFDPPSGGYWIADGGGSEQIKLFDSSHKLVKTFGKAGGRLEGNYDPTDFLGVTDIASDGRGGFIVVEPLSAPRRTAHFDAAGKLLREWYGGQQFYSFAAPDPENPNHVWMDSQWGWIMQCEADWKLRTWKVLACYRWGGDAPEGLFNRYKMAQPFYVRRLDLNQDRTAETYLISSSGLQLVDEKAGRLRVVSTLGLASHNHGWEWWKLSLEEQPQPWVEAVAKLGKNELKSLNRYRAFSWADANGDFEFQPEEFRLAPDAQAEGRGGFFLTRELDAIKQTTWGGAGGEGKPNWQRFPLQGFTASHAPIWDWEKFEPGPVSSANGMVDIFEGTDGGMYHISQSGNDDGYSALDTYAMGHGFGWPANMNPASAIIKWDKAGRMQWRAGNHATTQSSASGRLHHPVHFAGFVHGTIGVCDKVVQPVSFWTEDGLYAGSLLDRRADDGLPARVYSWWKGATDDFDAEHGRALFQYDMILGGALIPQPGGEAIYLGAGWNNCPAFRVSGWNEFQRQSGTVRLDRVASAALRSGTGLQSECHAALNSPAYVRDGQRVWAEPKRADQKKKPEFAWPVPDRTTGTFSLRYTGFVEPAFTEAYTFAIYKSSAGSARLFIGGRLILEASTTEKKFYSSPLPLTAGDKYAIEVEWTGPADGELHLCWESETQPIGHIPVASLYPPADAKASASPCITVEPPSSLQVRPVASPGEPAAIAWLLTRSGDVAAPLEVPLTWSGSAKQARDVKTLPAMAVFAAGKTTTKVEVLALPSPESAATTTQISMIPQVSPHYRLDGAVAAPPVLLRDPRTERIEVSQVSVRHSATKTTGGMTPELHADQLARLIDRSGLKKGSSEAAPLNGNEIKDAWFCAFTRPEKLELVFDLAALYTVSEVHVWNLNTTSAHGQGWGHGDTVREAATQILVSFALPPRPPTPRPNRSISRYQTAALPIPVNITASRELVATFASPFHPATKAHSVSPKSSFKEPALNNSGLPSPAGRWSRKSARPAARSGRRRCGGRGRLRSAFPAVRPPGSCWPA